METEPFIIFCSASDHQQLLWWIHLLIMNLQFCNLTTLSSWPCLLLCADRTRRKSIAIGKARMMWRLMRWSVPSKRDENGSWPCISFECLGWQRGENGRKRTQNQQSCGRCGFWTKTRHDLEKILRFCKRTCFFAEKRYTFVASFQLWPTLETWKKVPGWFSSEERIIILVMK